MQLTLRVSARCPALQGGISVSAVGRVALCRSSGRLVAIESRRESWPQESEQIDKQSFCLTAGKIAPRIRRDDEQTTTPEPHTGFASEGGAGRHRAR